MKITSPKGNFLCGILFAMPVIMAIPVHGGVLTSTTFNGANPWTSYSASGTAATVAFGINANGTIDTQQAITDASPVYTNALYLNATPSSSTWSASVTSGPVAISTNPETNLAKLTVSFDLWASSARAVRVKIESLDASNNPTGSLSKLVVPPVESAFYRFSFDLNDPALTTTGTFTPGNPKIRLTYTIGSADAPDPWPSTGTSTIRIDNVTYTSPKYYVRAAGTTGKDQTTSSYGLSEAKPFKTLQYAADQAVAGDVICIMDGTYNGISNNFAVGLTTAGAPDKWIVLRSSPGYSPLLRSVGWHGIFIGYPAAYIEVRDLTLQGFYPATPEAFYTQLAAAKIDGAYLSYTDSSKTALRTEPADATHPAYYGDSQYNTGGVTVSGRSNNDQVRGIHDVRVIRCNVSDFPGGGYAGLQSDRVTLEGNTFANNCYFTRYGSSGVSTLHSWNFDRATNHKYFMIGNTCYKNNINVWVVNGGTTPTGITDGSGIILDVSRQASYDTGSDGHDYSADNNYYTGRTLVQNNFCFANGGGGIITTIYPHADIVNNTMVGNVQNPYNFDSAWAELLIGGGSPGSNDIRCRNNIVVARNGVGLTSIGTGTTNVSFDNNLYYGEGRNPVVAGNSSNVGNVTANPLLMQMSVVPGEIDARLATSSPALDTAVSTHVGAARNDRLGVLRPVAAAPDKGAYEGTFIRPGTPAAPTVAVIAGGNQLTWINQSGIVYYSVYRSTSSGSDFVEITPPAGITTGSYLDAVAPPQVYYYRITATNAYGESSPSLPTVSHAGLAPNNLVTAEFTDGAGTATARQYPGLAGDGWSGPWAPSSAAVTGQVPLLSPLQASTGFPLLVSRTSGTTAQEGVYRQWSNTARPYNKPTRLTFDFRLDSINKFSGPFSSATDVITLTDRNVAGVGQANDNTFLIRAFGNATGSLAAREWGIYNGTPGTADSYNVSSFRGTGLILRSGVTYTFTIDLYAADAAGTTNGKTNGTYDATITDGETTVTVSNSGFVSAAYSLGGYLAFSTQQSAATDNLTFLVDSISLSGLSLASTTTVLGSSSNPASLGAAVTLTATVNSSGGIPSGTVAFLDGSTLLGTSSLNASGVATLATSSLSIGTHSLTATYIPAGNYSGSTSSALALVVKESFAAWTARYGLASNSDGSDPDGDGLVNLIEYAQDSSPLSNTSGVPPTVTPVTYGTDSYLTLTTTKNPNATDLTYLVESSGDLLNWSSAQKVVITNTSTSLVVRDSVPLGLNKRFLHLKVSH